MTNNYQGIGFYSVRYSDGGQPYTNDGAVWIDSEWDFYELMRDASSTQSEYHIPYSEYLGDPQEMLGSIVEGVRALEKCMCEASPCYNDFRIGRNDLAAILEGLTYICAAGDVEELSGPLCEAVHLAALMAEPPSYGALAAIEEYAERVFCQVNFCEDLEEYAETRLNN